MTLQLLAHSHVPLPGLEAVDRADVVKSSAGHEATGGGVGTGHDPAGAQGNGVDLMEERGREGGRDMEGYGRNWNGENM